MTPPIFGKEKSARGQIVGVIASEADLRRAVQMAEPPDVFELRLDALAPIADRVQQSLSNLQAPLIITARDRREGGIGALNFRERRDLLCRFLPYGQFVDVELRSARKLRDLFTRRAKLIVSFHDFRGTPSLAVLRTKLKRANALRADIFKVATTLNRAEELARLLAFFDEAAAVMPTAAMGMGKLGRQSRTELARRGSVLNYSGIRASRVLGQLSIAELRRLLRPRAI